MSERARAELEEGVACTRVDELERWAQSSEGLSLPLREWIALAETWRIARALRVARGNRSAAARALGIGRRTLYTKMEKLGLVPTWGVSRASSTPVAETEPPDHAV
jgi:DNA-binding NtrC family response regulator